MSHHYYHRNIDKDLLLWANDPGRKVLLVRGARQGEKGIEKGIRTSLENFAHYENIEVYPMYAISEITKQ